MDFLIQLVDLLLQGYICFVISFVLALLMLHTLTYFEVGMFGFPREFIVYSDNEQNPLYEGVTRRVMQEAFSSPHDKIKPEQVALDL